MLANSIRGVVLSYVHFVRTIQMYNIYCHQDNDFITHIDIRDVTIAYLDAYVFRIIKKDVKFGKKNSKVAFRLDNFGNSVSFRQIAEDFFGYPRKKTQGIIFDDVSSEKAIAGFQRQAIDFFSSGVLRISGRVQVGSYGDEIIVRNRAKPKEEEINPDDILCYNYYYDFVYKKLDYGGLLLLQRNGKKSARKSLEKAINKHIEDNEVRYGSGFLIEIEPLLDKEGVKELLNKDIRSFSIKKALYDADALERYNNENEQSEGEGRQRVLMYETTHYKIARKSILGKISPSFWGHKLGYRKVKDTDEYVFDNDYEDVRLEYFEEGRGRSVTIIQNRWFGYTRSVELGRYKKDLTEEEYGNIQLAADTFREFLWNQLKFKRVVGSDYGNLDEFAME